MDKNQLEEEIEKTAEDIFAIPKEERETSSDFSTFRTKLATDVWKWANVTFGKKVNDCTVEIMKCINLSIKSFRGDSKNYMHYISAGLKNEIRRAHEKNKVYEEITINIPEKKRRRIINILRDVEGYGKNISDFAVQSHIAYTYNITAEELSELIGWYKQSFVQQEKVISYDDGEISLFDLNPDPTDFESEVVFADNLEEALKAIDCAFKEVQERTQPYLSALLVRQILEELESAGIDSKSAYEHLSGCQFAKTKEADRVKEAFLNNDVCPTQQKVASWFQKDKTDASRTMKMFLERMKKQS